MDVRREDVVRDLVAGALEASDAAQAYSSLAGAARAALGADRAILLHRGNGQAAVACEVPTASSQPLQADALAATFGAPGEVTPGRLARHGFVLGLGLRPAWGLALVRTRPAWTPEECGALAELAPYLALVLEHALRASKLADAAAREAAADAEHEHFLSVISHELRNPLAPILMWTSTLRRVRAADPEVQRATQAIAQAVGLARRLIEELLDLSRLERGVVQLSLETVDLGDVVEGSVAARRAAADEAKIALEEDVPQERVAVRGDPARLAQVVAQLLENAIKFTPAGGRVSIGVARRGANAELTVRDTGPGVPADVVPRLFTPFVQGPNGRGGLGLGLALAHRFLALQQGRIEATNATDGGAVFVITLPIERPKR